MLVLSVPNKEKIEKKQKKHYNTINILRHLHQSLLLMCVNVPLFPLHTDTRTTLCVATMSCSITYCWNKTDTVSQCGKHTSGKTQFITHTWSRVQTSLKRLLWNKIIMLVHSPPKQLLLSDSPS